VKCGAKVLCCTIERELFWLLLSVVTSTIAGNGEVRSESPLLHHGFGFRGKLFYRILSLNGKVRSESPLLLHRERAFLVLSVVTSTIAGTQFSYLLLLHKSAQLMLEVCFAYSEHLV
jgi:hypothetical protein